MALAHNVYYKAKGIDAEEDAKMEAVCTAFNRNNGVMRLHERAMHTASKIKVTKSSIKGKGMMATQFVCKGAILSVAIGELTNATNKLLTLKCSALIQYGRERREYDGQIIVDDTQTPINLINHKCFGNNAQLHAVNILVKTTINGVLEEHIVPLLVAKTTKNVKAGQEFTMHYGIKMKDLEEFPEIPCIECRCNGEEECKRGYMIIHDGDEESEEEVEGDAEEASEGDADEASEGEADEASEGDAEEASEGESDEASEEESGEPPRQRARQETLSPEF
jgi:hypothetical protein